MNTYGRIYQNMPIGKLLRLKTFFMTCRFQILIKNLNNLYTISSKVLGKKFTNNFIKYIYGDIFLAGESTKELEKCLSQLKIDGLSGISDYAREFLTIEEEKTEIDTIIKIYKDSIDSSIKVDNTNSIAMKVSSFGNVDSLKRLNSYQFALCTLEDNLDRPYEEIAKEFANHKITDLLFSKDLIERIKKETNGKKFDLNLYEMILTENNKLQELIKEGLKLKETELNKLKQFVHNLHVRLMQVFDHAMSKDCLIMVDAEQSYLRFITDYIVAYYFKKFNNGKCILAQTLQCYLKTQQHDLHKWKKFCDERNLKLGLKLVRGAYMNEEKRIANEKGLIYPICNFIEDTNQNYNSSIEFLFKNYRSGDKVL
jgi:proline dehydrogenase